MSFDCTNQILSLEQNPSLHQTIPIVIFFRSHWDILPLINIKNKIQWDGRCVFILVRYGFIPSEQFKTRSIFK